MITCRVQKLTQICSEQLNGCLIRQLDSVPYETKYDAVSVARAIIESAYVKKENHLGVKKIEADPHIFFRIIDKTFAKDRHRREENKTQKLQKKLIDIFHQIHQLELLNDSEFYENSSLENLSYSLAIQMIHWAGRICKMTKCELELYFQNPKKRGFIGSMQMLERSFEIRRDSDEGAVDFNLHQLLEKNGALHLRNFRVDIFRDFDALRWIFANYPDHFCRMINVLKKYPISMAAAFAVNIVQYSSINRYPNSNLIALYIIRCNYRILDHVSLVTLHDIDFLKSAVKLDYRSFLYVPNSIQKHYLNDFVESNPKVFSLLDIASRDVKEIALKVLSSEGNLLQYATKNLQDFQQLVSLAVSNNGCALKFASKRLQNQKEIAKLAVQNCGWALEFVSADLRNDKEIVLAAISGKPNSIKYASRALQADKEIFYTLLVSAARLFELIPPLCNDFASFDFNGFREGIYRRKGDAHCALSDNFSTVLSSLKINSLAFLLASSKLQRNAKIIQACLENYPFSPIHCLDTVENNSLFCAALVYVNGWEIQYLSSRLRDSKKIALLAVSSNGLALQFLSEELKDDEDIVRLAIASKKPVFHFASKRLQWNEDLLSEAVKLNYLNYIYLNYRPIIDTVLINECFRQNPNFLEDQTNRLYDDKVFVTQLVKQDSLKLCYVSYGLRSCRSIIMSAVEENGIALQFASAELKEDKSIVLRSLESRYATLKFAAESLRDNFELASISVQFNIENYFTMSLRLQKDPRIIDQILAQNDNFLKDFKDNLIESNQIAILIQMVKKNIWFFFKANSQQRGNVALCLAALQVDPAILANFPEQIFSSKDFIAKAFPIMPEVIRCASPSIRSDLEFIISLVELNSKVLSYISTEIQPYLSFNQRFKLKLFFLFKSRLIQQVSLFFVRLAEFFIDLKKYLTASA